jgi:adenylylsulfate kinase
MAAVKFIIPSHPLVSKADRQRLNGHKSFILWLTGFSGSGKSTLAKALDKALYQRGIHCYVLDGDNIRTGLNKGLGFSRIDREENIRRIGEVAKLFIDAGMVVITALVSPFATDRKKVRQLVAPDEFIEVFVDCPLKICEARDVKGFYKKARQGRMAQFTGIGDPYEAPLNPEIVVHTDRETIIKSVQNILDYLIQHKHLKNLQKGKT